jgi:D-hexose-6-phosphate mutarotase
MVCTPYILTDLQAFIRTFDRPKQYVLWHPAEAVSKTVHDVVKLTVHLCLDSCTHMPTGRYIKNSEKRLSFA